MKYYLIAGEASGDLHGSNLIKELKLLDNNAVFRCWGGDLMEQQGATLVKHYRSLAFMGFLEVLLNIKTILRNINFCKNDILKFEPDVLILIDYPGFNLRIAEFAKSKGLKIFYYISPQVWAWNSSRVHKIKKFVDNLFVILPFEKNFYKKFNYEVDFVGHPLIDTIKLDMPRETLLQSVGLPSDKLTIGILPGSRAKEVERLLPIMLKAAKILYNENDRVQFLLLKAPTVDLDHLKKYIDHASISIKIINDKTYDGINASHLCMVASGTATLETAILQKPMVVIYKTSLLTWFLAKLFVKIPYIGLVNVVAGKKVVPEYIQFDATPEKIAAELKNIFTNEVKIAEIKSDLSRVKSSLGSPGASRRAAEIILQTV